MRSFRLFELMIMWLVLGLAGCKTPADRGNAALMDMRTSEADIAFRNGCVEGDTDACLGLEMTKCGLATASEVESCQEVGAALASTQRRADAQKVVHAFNKGCAKTAAADNTCLAKLAAVECFGGDLDKCDAIKPASAGKANAKGLIAIYNHACRKGRGVSCRLLHQLSRPNTEKATAAVDAGCSAGHSSVCQFQTELKTAAAEAAVEQKQREEQNKRDQAVADQAFQVTIEQEAASGKCTPKRYQTLAGLIGTFSTFYRDTSLREWRLSNHEILALGSTPRSFNFRSLDREHIIVVITDGKVTSLKATDTKGNEAGPLDTHLVWLARDVPRSVTGINTSHFLYQVMKPLEASTVSATGMGCSLVIVVSK